MTADSQEDHRSSEQPAQFGDVLHNLMTVQDYAMFVRHEAGLFVDRISQHSGFKGDKHALRLQVERLLMSEYQRVVDAEQSERRGIIQRSLAADMEASQRWGDEDAD